MKAAFLLLPLLFVFVSCSSQKQIPVNQITPSKPIPVEEVSDSSNKIARDITSIKTKTEDISNEVKEATAAAKEAKTIAEKIEKEGTAANSDESKKLVAQIEATERELKRANDTITKLREFVAEAERESAELQKRVTNLVSSVAEVTKELTDIRLNKKIAEDNLVIEQEKTKKLIKEVEKQRGIADSRLKYVWIVWGVAGVAVILVVLKVLIATQKINPAGPLRWL